MKHPVWGRGTTRAVITVGGLLFLAGCGDSGDRGGRQITWFEGTPPPGFGSDSAGTDRSAMGEVLPPPQAEQTSTIVVETESPTSFPVSTAFTTAEPAAEGEPLGEPLRALRAEDRLRTRPNELGWIPVLMYHSIVNGDVQSDDGYTRSVAQFRADLQTLYDHGYYVVPLAQVVANAIVAPVGKQPVVLTFDDGTVGHFRYLIGDNGAVRIDPNSVVGVLEAFYADHPDFGRGGFFAVPPSTCFDWETNAAEPEQTPYCGQKLKWLVDNGYEVGNHTYDHADLLDLEDDQFIEAVGRGWTGLTDVYPEGRPDILALPFGNYPDREKHPVQRAMMREGFDFEGQRVTIVAALMVGANPAVSPASTEWDPLFVARIRAYEGEMGSKEWLRVLRDAPGLVYRSDGDPGTITVPSETESGLGSLDVERLEAEGKTIIVYDSATGDVV